MKHTEAKILAKKFLGLLVPECARAEIVGSVKRGDKPDVHDIEILVIDGLRPIRIEFGMKQKLELIVPKTRLGNLLNYLCETGLLKLVMGGEKLRKYIILEAGEVNPFHLEVYIVMPETWGIQNVIRTGPSEFSHKFVTNRRYGGFLPDDLEYVRGETKIVSEGTALNLPEERDALGLIGYGWIEPRERGRFVEFYPAIRSENVRT